jgi:peptidoglycan-N-acetylglucosamine deacetylase
MKKSLSQAEKLGGFTILLTIPLFFISPWLAGIPLLLFVLLCLAAPFFPQWGFFLPVISRSRTGSKAVALTFDDGPSPGSTPLILDLLERYHLQATFFVVGKEAEKYPELIAEIVARGHTIGNHSWQHDNFLMLKSRERLRQDIQRTQQLLISYGVRPLLFRPPTGITGPRLKPVLEDAGLLTVTFSCRPFDYGNKKLDNLADRVMEKIKPGDIILLHDLPPETDGANQTWLNELNTLFTTLQEENYEIQSLETLIGTAVMAIEE